MKRVAAEISHYKLIFISKLNFEKKKKAVGINEQVKQAERQIMGAILGHSNVCFVHAKVV